MVSFGIEVALNADNAKMLSYRYYVKTVAISKSFARGCSLVHAHEKFPGYMFEKVINGLQNLQLAGSKL